MTVLTQHALTFGQGARRHITPPSARRCARADLYRCTPAAPQGRKPGAALAVAGMEIACAETKAGSTPAPEFRAKSKASGKTYEVEAKRKNGWKAPTGDVTNAEFQRELEGYVRDQIYNASKKKLTNPVYWFELRITTMMAEADWRAVAEKAEAAIRDAENSMTVDGQPIALPMSSSPTTLSSPTRT